MDKGQTPKEEALETLTLLEQSLTSLEDFENVSEEFLKIYSLSRFFLTKVFGQGSDQLNMYQSISFPDFENTQVNNEEYKKTYTALKVVIHKSIEDVNRWSK